jgi:hypothetical protein
MNAISKVCFAALALAAVITGTVPAGANAQLVEGAGAAAVMIA